MWNSFILSCFKRDNKFPNQKIESNWKSFINFHITKFSRILRRTITNWAICHRIYFAGAAVITWVRLTWVRLGLARNVNIPIGATHHVRGVKSFSVTTTSFSVIRMEWKSKRVISTALISHSGAITYTNFNKRNSAKWGPK